MLLYESPGSPYAQKIKIALREKAVAFEVEIPESLGTGRTDNPFGTGKLNFDQLAPALVNCGVPHSWWCVDLCFWPHAWEVTADSKKYLDKLRAKYAAA